jgi:hypothetical protein
MTWCAPQRIALWNLVAASTLLIAGCSSLNWGSGPSQDPFLSVADPLEEAFPVARGSDEPIEDDSILLELTSADAAGKNGELPDRSRPER